MADNITTPVAASTTLATDEIAGVHHPLTKLEFGADGAATPVSSINPLPVALTGSIVLPTGAATEASTAAISGKLPTLGAKASSGSVSVVPASDATFAISASAMPLPAGAAADATVTAMSAKLPTTLGAKTSANSLSVAPASDASFAITASVLPLPTGAASETTLTAVSAKLPTLGTKAAAGSISVTPSSDQDPIFDHANGVLVAITANATLITTGAGHKYLRIGSDADALIRTDGGDAANNGQSIRIIANQPEVIPVPPSTAIKAMAITGTANIRATPMAAR